MSLYRSDHIIRSSDVDAFRRLRLSVLFTLLQEASIAHTTQLGMGRNMTLDRGLLWIVALQQVSVSRLPVYDEKIELVSWPDPMMHLYFPRSYRILDSCGQALIEASALWALMDQKTRRIIFPEEHGIRIEGSPEQQPLPMARAPKMPALPDTAVFTVPYSYTDLNGHMNNTRYLDLAEDRMPVSLRCRSVRQIQTEFTAEAKAEESVTLRCAASDSVFAMSGETDRRLFRLLLRYES